MPQLEAKRTKVFCENVYDLETFFESLSIASNHDKELLFLDLVFSSMRLNPHGDLTELFYTSLQKLKIMK